MSPRDAQRYDVKDEDRRLYVRLDDGKVNPALVSGEPRWYRRSGVVIANGDDVGVLIPEDLGSPQDEGEGADGMHRTIVGCLLARVPGPEITLNAAAKLLAWSGDERFAKYRQTNPMGHQRVNESLRRAILTACRRNICMVSDGRSRASPATSTAAR